MLADSLSLGETHKLIQEERPPSSDYESVIQREVRAYRAKYLFSLSCTRIFQYIKRRTLHGPEVYLALLLIFLERFAYYSVVGNITDTFLKQFDGLRNSTVYRSLIQTALFEMVAQIMFPIAGFIGDRFVGRYRTMHLSMWLLLIGYVSLTFVASFEHNYDDQGPQHVNRDLLPVCFVIIATGSAGFQANMIPLGADQIIGRPSDEISAYFYWYYWVRNLGAVIFGLSYLCPFDYDNIVFGFMATGSIALGLIILQFFGHRFHIDKKRHNPLKLVIRVVRFVAAVKRPELRSAFSYTGVEAPSRMDLAKDIHGGRFTNVEVEDVKTFLRLLVFLASLVGVLTIYTGVVNVIAAQDKHMNGSFINSLQHGCTFSDTSVWFFNIGFIVLAIPLINFGLYPLLREYTPNMQKRIGIGHILTILSPLVLLLLSSVGFGILFSRDLGQAATESCMFADNPSKSGTLPVSSWFVTIPHLTVSLAEVFLIVSSLEFFYAQSPHTMRGMMVGLFFFAWGVATVIANLFVVIFTEIPVGVMTCGIWYYMVLVVLAVVSFVVFIFISRWYKNRNRGDIEPDLYYRET